VKILTNLEIYEKFCIEDTKFSVISRNDFCSTESKIILYGNAEVYKLVGFRMYIYEENNQHLTMKMDISETFIDIYYLFNINLN